MATPRRRAAILVALPLFLSVCGPSPTRSGDLRRVVEVPGEPRSVVWAVQLSDLHLSAFHPERTADFRRHVGDALAMVNPALVLITGDLTGKLPPAFFVCVCLVVWFALRGLRSGFSSALGTTFSRLIIYIYICLLVFYSTVLICLCFSGKMAHCNCIAAKF